jgi:5-methyltetrahydropteroyltriglutamate--homocysteine methyltransferase
VKRSIDRVLTTHSGSLVRTPAIIEGMKARTVGRPYDETRLAEDIRAGVLDVVRRQVEAGIDIPNDGEYPRRGFMGYVNERLGGLEPRAPEPEEMVLVPGRERDRFADFSELYDRYFRVIYMYPEISMDDVRDTPSIIERFRLIGPITYTGQQAVQTDIANLKDALTGLNVADAFITAVTPNFRKGDRDIDRFYPSTSAYLCPGRCHARRVQGDHRRGLHPSARPRLGRANGVVESMDEGVDVLNHALQGIPEDQARYHYCWGRILAVLGPDPLPSEHPVDQIRGAGRGSRAGQQGSMETLTACASYETDLAGRN